MEQKAPERIHLRISGHVQGVGFRWFVMTRARRLELAGWVRNNPDGSVELEATGPADRLAALREQVATGPHGARVDHVSELPNTSGELLNPFNVAR
jgi:acylphosphatase